MKPKLIFSNPLDHMGCERPPREPRETLRAMAYPTGTAMVEYPDHFLYEHGWWPPANLDQGATPSCTIFAAATAQQNFEIKERLNVEFRYPELIATYNKISVNRGAYMQDAVRLWRNEGIPGHAIVLKWLERIRWWGGWRPYKFKIAAYTFLDRSNARDPARVKLCLYAYKGLGYACLAISHGFFQFAPTETVHLTDNDKILGYHAMAVVGYTPEGPVVAHTWGDRPRQVIGWDYWQRWNEGMYLVVDAKDVGESEQAELEGFQLLNTEGLMEDVGKITR